MNDTNKILDGKMLDKTQLVVFESETCSSCKAFKKDVMANWKSSFSIEKTYRCKYHWMGLKESVWATPTMLCLRMVKRLLGTTGAMTGRRTAFWLVAQFNRRKEKSCF